MSLKSESNKASGDEDSGIYTFEHVFDLLGRETIYEIEAVDRYGFRNDPIPRRTIHESKEDPPIVALPARAVPGANPSELDDVELEGLPVPKGEPFLISYYCSHKYGLGSASLKFRVIPAPKEGDSNEKSPDPCAWQELKLLEEKKGPGRFDERTGAFTGSGDRDSIQFHAVESDDPAILGRVKGGGRFLFQTAKIADGKAPNEGDRIEYYIEVRPFDTNDPKIKRPVGRSETRVKNVVSFEGFANWMRDWNEEGRVRAIELGQKKIFPGSK